jgi:hypothetical protein
MASSHDTMVESRPRELWADNLRVLVVADVIVVHTATGYLTGIVDWYYDERTASVLWSTVLSFPAVAGAMFGLGPLFLLAGWFSPRSVAHRGPGGFACSRLLRLGVPLAAFMLLIQPLADYVGSLGPDQVRTSFASALRTTEFSVMWFVAALPVFSLAYAALRWLRPAPQSRRPARLGVPAGRRRPDDRRGLAGGLAGVALELRRVLHRQVGRVAPRRRAVRPGGARRRNRVAARPAAGAGPAAGLDSTRRHDRGRHAVRGPGDERPGNVRAEYGHRLADDPVRAPGRHGRGQLVAVVHQLVRRRWPSHGPLLGKAARASYATYLIHPLVLTTIMVLLAPVALAPEIKFALVAIAAVAACYLAGYALTRMPGSSKVL